MTHPTKKNRGFTLMEVVIALVVFAVIAVVLLDSVTQVQQAIHESKTETNRNDLRRFVLRRALAATTANDANAGGSVPLPDGSDAAWSLSLSPTTLPDLHEIALEITWADGAKETNTIRVYRPEWSDPASRSALLQEHRASYPTTRLSTQ